MKKSVIVCGHCAHWYLISGEFLHVRGRVSGTCHYCGAEALYAPIEKEAYSTRHYTDLYGPDPETERWAYTL